MFFAESARRCRILPDWVWTKSATSAHTFCKWKNCRQCIQGTKKQSSKRWRCRQDAAASGNSSMKSVKQLREPT